MDGLLDPSWLEMGQVRVRGIPLRREEPELVVVEWLAFSSLFLM
jgi:hypothetical protein